MKIGDGIVVATEFAVAAAMSAGGAVAIGGGLLALSAGTGVLVKCVNRERRADFATQINKAKKRLEDSARIKAREKEMSVEEINQALTILKTDLITINASPEEFIEWDLDPETVSTALIQRLAAKNEVLQRNAAAHDLLKDILFEAFDAIHVEQAFWRDHEMYVHKKVLERTRRTDATTQDTNEKVTASAEIREDTNTIVHQILAKMEAQDGPAPDPQSEHSIEETIRGLLKAHEGHQKTAGEKLVAGDVGGAKSALRQLAAQQEKTVKDAAKTWLDIGNIAFLNDTQEALEAFTRVTELTPNDPVGWNQLGRLYCRIGDMNQAKVTFEKVLVIGEKRSDTLILSWAWGNLGNVEQNLGNHEVAIQCFQNSLNFYSDIDHKQGIADQYGNLGNAAKHKNCFDDAKDYYTKALMINMKIDCKTGKANQYNNLGVVEMNLGNLDKAVNCYQKSLALNEALGRKEGMATQYCNLGIVEQTRGNIKGACTYWRQSYDLFSQISAAPMIERVSGWLRDAGCDGAPEE